MNEDAKNSYLANLHKNQSGKILASLILYCNDITLAEDALQDAFEQAFMLWDFSKLDRGKWPINPSAWLYVTAKRKIIDKVRRQSSYLKLLALESEIDEIPEKSEFEYSIPEERLRLIFTCCHPALEQSACIALTLNTLCGLSVKEIARAFVVSESAMARKLSRAKRKIKDAGIAYTIPEHECFSTRLQAVLQVIYLIYNESHTAFEGQSLSRNDLAQESIRLARLLYLLLPSPEVLGLLSLLLLNDARSSARSSFEYFYIPLQYQNRNLWKKKQIREAIKLLDESMQFRKPGPFQIQAAISALHCQAKAWEETDWKQIKLLYQTLYMLEPTPIVALNRFVAIANSGDLIFGYRCISSLASILEKYQPYHAARADIQNKLGMHALAVDSYTKAISMTKNGCVRDFLIKKCAEVRKLVSNHNPLRDNDHN